MDSTSNTNSNSNSNSNSSSNSNSNNPHKQEPGLIAGHTEYIKGLTESAIGTVIDSPAWKSSGEQDKAHAVHTMKVAAEKRDAGAQGYGKVEELAGKAVGCEGMRNEGAASAKKD